MFIAKPRFITHDMYKARILRELDREQKRFYDKYGYDLYVGMTPPDFWKQQGCMTRYVHELGIFWGKTWRGFD